MMVKIYAEENANSRVRANLINPGSTRTGMRAQAMPGEDPKTIKPPEDITDAFVQLADPSCDHNGITLDCS